MPAKPGLFSDRLPTLLSTSRQEGFGSPPLHPPTKGCGSLSYKGRQEGPEVLGRVTALGEGPCKSQMPAPAAFATETALAAAGAPDRPSAGQCRQDQMPPSHPGALRAEGLSSPLPPAPAAGWQSVLSIHLGPSCWGPTPCVPPGHVYRPQGCFAAVGAVPVSPPVLSLCGHLCNCLPSFCSF